MGERASTACGRIVAIVFGLVAVALSVATPTRIARAFCFTGGEREVGDLQTLIQRDPRAALPLIRKQLAAHPGVHLAAWLYATESNAYSALEIEDKERATAAEGLVLLGDRPDPARLELLIQYGSSLEDPAAMSRVIDQVQSLRRTFPANSAANICAEGAAGVMEMELDEVEPSTRDVIDAYRASARPGYGAEHAALAFSLLTVMLQADDLDVALSLNREEMVWERAHDQTYMLANSWLARGTILNRQGDYPGAIEALRRSAALKTALHNPAGVAFAVQGICEALLGEKHYDEARAACARARDLYGDELDPSSRDKLANLVAGIDLGQGLNQAALDGLAVVVTNGEPMTAAPVIKAHRLRALALAGLGRWQDAYDEMAVYEALVAGMNQQMMVRQTVISRAEVDAERAQARAAQLGRELALSRNRQRVIEWRVSAVFGILVALLLLLGSHLLTTRRYQRVLRRRADEDALTRLSNRDCMTRVASAAIQNAQSTGESLAIALLDIDNFKSINDRFGHSTGDVALSLFADAIRTAPRDRWAAGRWGGEEFLLVMPGRDAPGCVAFLATIRESLRGRPRHFGVLDFSAGVVVADGRDLSSLVADADRALYAAKRSGRGRAVIAFPPNSDPPLAGNPPDGVADTWPAVDGGPPSAAGGSLPTGTVSEVA